MNKGKKMKNIGFIGLGHMGLPMAINLVKAGFTVTGFDLQSMAMEHFTNAGGIAANTLQQAARSQDIIITMLQTGQQVKQVCLGGDGLLDAATKGSLYIDCSTIDIATSRLIHQEANSRQIHSVDAPVSGGVVGAAAGKLTIMVGGTEQAFLQAKTILTALGTKIIHTGAAGSGQAAKICNNMILGISMIAVSEAFVLAEHLNLSPEKLFEVVTNSSGQCWAISNYAPVPGLLDNVPANNDYKPGFTAAMLLKDLRLSQESAAKVGISTPLGEKATALYQQLNDDGMADLDFSAIIKTIT